MMNDQAQTLRKLVESRSDSSPAETRLITVTSGKGGVGKSNFTLNFALALQSMGQKVLIFDADIGMANIDVLMGCSAPYNLYHLLKRHKTIWEIIQTGPRGLQFIAGGSGFKDLLDLSEQELVLVTEEIEKLQGHYDLILFDTGAGLSRETIKFIVAADEALVVTTPEPTSITDAYAVIKMINSMDYNVSFKLVVNRATDSREGKQTANKITLVAKRFLNLDIPTLGYVFDDPDVTKAVKSQTPFSLAYPNGDAARSVAAIASAYLVKETATPFQSGGLKGFIQRMFRLKS